MKRSKNMSVLVVEDDPSIQITTKHVLESEGYSVSLADHGREALETLRQMAPPCLVLLDINMPEMDGYEFLREKSQDPTIAAIPVVVVSATADVSRLDGDVSEFISKPFILEDLLTAVAKHCG